MLGDFDEHQKEQEDYFSRNCIFPKSNKLALDLGVGNGIQAISLFKLGFDVPKSNCLIEEPKVF